MNKFVKPKNGNIFPYVERINIEAKKSTDTNHVGWIKITSISTLTSEKASVTSLLYVDPNNQNNIKWKTF